MNVSRQRKPSQQHVDVLAEICNAVTQVTGVQLGEKQLSMVESRLSRRAIDLGLKDLNDYLSYYRSNSRSEIQPLISLLTTHHSYFFREFGHFEFLVDRGLKEVADAARARGDRKIRVWTAAASRGQEAYSLSMFMAYHLPRIAPDMGYEIIGTDIDPESIQIAQNGVFPRDDIKAAPIHYIGDHWVRGTGEISSFVKAKASIKSHCRFEVGNLLSIPNGWETKKFDVIFCRNVFIYFTPEQIENIARNLTARLQPTGYLFIGISESLSKAKLGLESAGPSIYMAKSAQKSRSQAPAAVEPARALRVVCVDDSPSVHTLLKQVLKPEMGFEIVGTAMNGVDAAKLLQTVKADVMTLDIHMPEQDGLSYLISNWKSSHPPVVMLSSVSRDDADLAMKCLNAGASDYIEKPVLSNLAARGEEIRTKLKNAFRSQQAGAPPSLRLDQSFAKQILIEGSDSKLGIVLMGLGHRAQVKQLIRELSGPQPPYVIALDGINTVLEAMAKEFTKECGRSVQYSPQLPDNLIPGSIHLVEASLLSRLPETLARRRVSVLIYGTPSISYIPPLRSLKNKQILLEDLGGLRPDAQWIAAAQDVTPATSFSYMSNLFLSKPGT